MILHTSLAVHFNSILNSNKVLNYKS